MTKKKKIPYFIWWAVTVCALCIPFYSTILLFFEKVPFWPFVLSMVLFIGAIIVSPLIFAILYACLAPINWVQRLYHFVIGSAAMAVICFMISSQPILKLDIQPKSEIRLPLKLGSCLNSTEFKNDKTYGPL